MPETTETKCGECPWWEQNDEQQPAGGLCKKIPIGRTFMMMFADEKCLKNELVRLSRRCVITEKIDGTNAQVYIGEDGEFLVGCRTRWITPDNDNYGFAKWAYEHEDELRQLGSGHHFGEWWGQGIQRRYNLPEKRFSLFNVGRWTAETPPPSCCSVVPVLFEGIFDSNMIEQTLEALQRNGSYAAPGFNNPEGIIIYHTASRMLFKKTIKNDESRKEANQ